MASTAVTNTKTETSNGANVVSVVEMATTKSEMYTGHSALSGRGVCILMIDPQNDFHPPNGSLAVQGADEDAARIAKMMDEKAADIDAVFVTLDTHMRYHIAHGLFWKDAEGNHPGDFTMISNEDVKAKKWMPTHEKWESHCDDYTSKLEAAGKFQLCIWPEHCLVGTAGHAVYPSIMESIHRWEGTRQTTSRYFIKGNNALSEHYRQVPPTAAFLRRRSPLGADDPPARLRALCAVLSRPRLLLTVRLRRTRTRRSLMRCCPTARSSYVAKPSLTA